MGADRIQAAGKCLNAVIDIAGPVYPLDSRPTGVNVYIFAQRYHAGAALATTTVFLSTTFSMFTLSMLLSWFRAAGFL